MTCDVILVIESDNLENWDNFIASHTAALAQDWIKKKCPGFVGKNEWPTPCLSPLDYHVWDAMLGCYQKYTPKPTNIAELKTALLPFATGVH